MKPLWTKKDLMSAASASDPSKYFLKNIDGVWGVSIDDRTIKKGDLFVALIGDKFNGHDFIENAIGKGAHGIIVSDKKLANKYNGLLVKDTKKALKQINDIALPISDPFINSVLQVTNTSWVTL